METKAKKKHELKLTIQGIPWKACFVSKRQMAKLFKEGPVMGYCDASKHRIYVDYERPYTTVLSTFWHEWLHAVVDSISSNEEESLLPEETTANLVGNCMVEILPIVEELLRVIKELAVDDDHE
jgi:hypothetical protein